MSFCIKHCLPLVGLLAVSSTVNAELVSLQGDSLIFSYDTDNLYNMGNVEVIGNQLLFHPSLSIAIDSQTFDGYSPAPIFASVSYSAIIDVNAKPGFRIDDHRITNSGYAFNEFGPTGPYASIYSSTTPLPQLTLSGALELNSESYYLYDAPGGIVEVPVYGYQTVEEIIGYTPELDEFGNIIGQTPIYETRQVEVIIGYNPVETFFPVYKINGASLGLSEVAVDFQVSAVPLPASVWLFLSGLGITGMSAKQRFPRRIRQGRRSD